MNIIKSLILIISIFNIAFAQLPPSPGPIQQNQLNQKPTVAYYGFSYEIGFFPLSSQCNNFNQEFKDVYSPIITLNDTTLLAYSNSQGQLSIAAINEDGVHQLEIPSQLQSFATSNDIISPIYYDDQLDSYFFINSNNQIISFSISTNSWTTNGIKDFITLGRSQYYDLASRTFYVSGMTNISINSFMVYQSFSASNTRLTFYTVSDFNLEVDIGNIKIAGFDNYVILFGTNIQNRKSYLYQIDLSAKTSVLLGEMDYDATLITGVNSRYVLLVSGDKASMQLFDLELDNSSTIYSNACAPYSPVHTFLSSIVLKNIFVN